MEPYYLEDKYGPALEFIRDIFFGLDAIRSEQLFTLYGERYGWNAAAYARKTMWSWSSGTVQMSGQTYARILELLPCVMSADEKFQLLKLLRQHTLDGLRKQKIHLVVTDAEGAGNAFRRLLQIVHATAQVELPSWFREIRAWLCQSETQTLQYLVKEFEQQAHLVRVVDLITNVSLLYELSKELPFGARITVQFEMPTAHVTIELKRQRGKTMGNADHESNDVLVRLQQAAIEYEHLDGRINFVDYVLRTLTPEEASLARELAIREGVELQALVYRIKAQTEVGRENLEGTMRAAHEMKRRGHRGTISSEISTGAGTTKIEIHNDRGPLQTLGVVAGIAVIVGVLLWFAFTLGIIRPLAAPQVLPTPRSQSSIPEPPSLGDNTAPRTQIENVIPTDTVDIEGTDESIKPPSTTLATREQLSPSTQGVSTSPPPTEISTQLPDVPSIPEGLTLLEPLDLAPTSPKSSSSSHPSHNPGVPTSDLLNGASKNDANIPQLQTCTRCEGNDLTQEVCSRCDGRDLTKEFCSRCDGRDLTKELCSRCNGQDLTQKDCLRCLGTGSKGGTNCYLCGGTGKQRACYLCSGTGRQRTCYLCNGTGKKRVCYLCGGTGKKRPCYRCGGSGKIRSSS